VEKLDVDDFWLISDAVVEMNKRDAAPPGK